MMRIMEDLKEFLKPNKIKLTLFLSLAIPLIILLIMIFSQNYSYTYYTYWASRCLVNPALFLITISPLLLGGLILSYLLGSLIDYYIQNRNLKIFIVIISGLISLGIIYVLYKMVTEPIICDPVHVPPNQNISDPVHEPQNSGIYHTKMLQDIRVDARGVQDSFERCIQSLGDFSSK